MNDELFLSTDEDSDLEAVEHRILKNIEDQILNKYGEFTGNILTEIDHIHKYIDIVFSNPDATSIIEDFEDICKTAEREDEYDILTNGLIEIFRNNIGINVDTDRETFFFSDIYDIYLVFVLSLKDTIVQSTKQFYRANGITINKLTVESISEYILTDEFSATDVFIQNAAKISGNVSLINIRDKISDYSISIDQERFIDYIYPFIVDNLS